MSIVRTNTLKGPEDRDLHIEVPSGAQFNIAGYMTLGTNGQICLPMGTTAQRPSNPVAGMIRINTDNFRIEVYNGSDWQS